MLAAVAAGTMAAVLGSWLVAGPAGADEDSPTTTTTTAAPAPDPSPEGGTGADETDGAETPPPKPSAEEQKVNRALDRRDQALAGAPPQPPPAPPADDAEPIGPPAPGETNAALAQAGPVAGPPAPPPGGGPTTTLVPGPTTITLGGYDAPDVPARIAAARGAVTGRLLARAGDLAAAAAGGSLPGSGDARTASADPLSAALALVGEAGPAVAIPFRPGPGPEPSIIITLAPRAVPAPPVPAPSADSPELSATDQARGPPAGSIRTGDAHAIGNRSETTVTQVSMVAVNGGGSAVVDQDASVSNSGSAVANTGGNSTSGSGSGSGSGSIETGDASAVGNDSETEVTQVSMVAVNGKHSVVVHQSATVQNHGTAVADTGNNTAA